MDLHSKFTKITSLGQKTELMEYIDKRFTTAIIGSISSIEDHLYDLFNDEDWKKYWPQLREEILNKANRERRLVLKKMEDYEVHRLTKSNIDTKNLVERNYNK